MSKQEKIKQVLESIRLQVEDTGEFEKDVDSIMEMFDSIKSINTEGIEAGLNKKRITLSDLRQDIAYDWNFRPEMRGKYFRVSNNRERRTESK